MCHSGRHLAPFWLSFGRHLDPFGSIFDPFMIILWEFSMGNFTRIFDIFVFIVLDILMPIVDTLSVLVLISRSIVLYFRPRANRVCIQYRNIPVGIVLHRSSSGFVFIFIFVGTV